MAQESFYATGKRKTAVARVWLKPGNGKVTINNQSAADYFGGGFTRHKLEQPLNVTDTLAKYDIFATVHGSGKSSQAGALCHGIAKALLEVSIDYRHSLKKAGFLTRDSRAKERKKYGLKSARARFQYSKR